MNFSIMHNIKGEDRELNVAKRVSTGAMESIVNLLVESIFVDGQYKPVRFEPLFWLGVVLTYTDLDAKAFETGELFELFGDKHFTDKLSGVIDPVQLETIRNAAREMIDIKLHEHPLKKVCDKASDLLDTLKENVLNNLANEDVRNELKELLTKENITLFLNQFANR